MHYRIINRGRYYYIEYRIKLLFWDLWVSLTSRSTGTTLEFVSLDDAQDYLKRRRRHKQKKTVVFEGDI